jgi:hypothetical protein
MIQWMFHPSRLGYQILQTVSSSPLLGGKCIQGVLRTSHPKMRCQIGSTSQNLGSTLLDSHIPTPHNMTASRFRCEGLDSHQFLLFPLVHLSSPHSA